MFETIATLFHRGGPLVMSSIFLVLVISAAIVIERCYRYWMQYDLSNTEGFMTAVQKMIMNNSIENAIRLCQKARPKLLPYVISEVLKRANDTVEEMELATEQASLTVVPKVNKMISTLGTMANVATLLGLLGTIFGLMKSFGAAATATGAQKQSILAEGIAEALTATSFGLGTALLCILTHGLLSIKQQSILAKITENSAKMIDVLYTRKLKIDSSKK